jgi:hypothetical protein
MQKKLIVSATLFTCASITGCATTVEIQVPHSEGDKFEACLIDPTVSYQPKPDVDAKKSALVLGLDANTVLRTAGGSDRLFVTKDQVKCPNGPSSDVSWAQAFVTPWHTSAAQLAKAESEAEELWCHNVHQAFLGSYNQLSMPLTNVVKNPAPIKSSEVLDYLQRTRSVAEKSGWDAMAAHAATQLNTLLNAPKADLVQTRLIAQKMIAAIYISTYLKAYFRNGEFVTLNWNLGNPLSDMEKLADKGSADEKKRIDKILDELRTIDPNASGDLDNIINKTLSGTVGKIASVGLVTRGGDSLAMPAITLTADFTQFKPADPTQSKTLTGTKVDANAVLEEVVRVTFEALFDSMNRVPAVSSATGVNFSKDYTSIALPDFARVASTYRDGPTMDSDEFGMVDADGGKADALVSSAMASLIRGANIAALNNEALANTLSKIASTAARKVTERVTWCYYAVIGPQSTDEKEHLAPRASKTVVFKLK